jgi:hypothetical protein
LIDAVDRPIAFDHTVALEPGNGRDVTLARPAVSDDWRAIRVAPLQNVCELPLPKI